jgi:hypothetical protein
MEEGVVKKLRILSWDDFLNHRRKLNIPQALECLYELAESDHPLALLQLGKAYHFGLYGLKINKQMSIEYLKKSDHPIANYYLHFYHKYGKNKIGTNHFFLKALHYLDDKKVHDYDKATCLNQAIKLFEHTATQCNIYEAYYHLSQIDRKHRIKHLKRGANNGDEQCQFELCKYYEAKHQYNKSWSFIKKYWKQIPEKRTKHAIYDDIEKQENTRRVCLYILLARTKGNRDNEWWIFPKDVVNIIVKMIWETRNDDSWSYIY